MIIGESSEVSFYVEDASGNPVTARVHFEYTHFGNREQLERITDSSGCVEFDLPDMAMPLRLVCIPLVPGFWAVNLQSIEDGDPIVLPRLPQFTEAAWWLRCLGIDTSDVGRGSGIKIGVLDWGFSAGHGLDHALILNEFGCVASPRHSDGRWQHGESVCRILSDRSIEADLLSVAPGADVFCVDVADGDGRIEPDRAASAIVSLAAHSGVDIVNLSWGSFECIPDDTGAWAAGYNTDFQGLADAIHTAVELGVSVVAAAGNDPCGSKSVSFPGVLDDCIAVGAVGLRDWGPESSVSRWFSTHSLEGDCIGSCNDVGGLFSWSDSGHGLGLDVVGPGVGVVFQRDGLPAYDVTGTSFAAPMISGMMAIELAADTHYLALPRDRSRVEYARQKLTSMCRRTGIHPVREGLGVPKLL